MQRQGLFHWNRYTNEHLKSRQSPVGWQIRIQGLLDGNLVDEDHRRGVNQPSERRFAVAEPGWNQWKSSKVGMVCEVISSLMSLVV
jgi:hypothetical protein